MPIIVMDIRSMPGDSVESVIDSALRKIHAGKSDIQDAGLYKSSLDARKRDDIHFVNSVMIRMRSKEREMKLSRSFKNVKYFEEAAPVPDISSAKREGRVVIAGFGPAGMFCALVLSEYGYKPVVLERGADVDTRVKAVESFWSGGELDTETNVQFGEGGAGTFSDGKLTTRITDPLCRYVLQRLCDFGAPKEILHMAKPHIGTDRLRSIVKAIRQRIIENGGEVRFMTPLSSIKLDDGSIYSVYTPSGEIRASAVIAAIGHSARDTFEMLLGKGIAIEPKPFSVGARIEHKQSDVDESLYGDCAQRLSLPKGEYQLSYRNAQGRACYTFCMCPGGQVVAAASEQGGIVTNGMSEYARSGKNANAAVAVSVSPDDFGNNPLDGVDFARSIERRAYSISGGWSAPATTVGCLFGMDTKASVIPSYRPGVIGCDFSGLFPGFVLDTMKEGLNRFAKQMQCFKDMSAVLTAPETRTSSPIRILRTIDYNAVGIDNLYPCGEGAGYAGGIVSAAVDGVRVALQVAKSFAPD